MDPLARPRDLQPDRGGGSPLRRRALAPGIGLRGGVSRSESGRRHPHPHAAGGVCPREDGAVRFNVETKIRPDRPEETPGPEAFADAVVAAVREAGVAARTTIQSFDWRTLRYVQKTSPDLVTVCLTEPATLQAGSGAKGASPWLAGFDPAAHAGSIPRTVSAAGGRIWSPNFHEVTRESLAEAHGLGLRVIPWTVNRPEEMAALIDLGVDGLITDRPDLARTVMESKGLSLPPPSPVAP